jgi:hypothetical protein
MELPPGRSLSQISKGELPEAHESLQLALAICDRELDTTSPVLGDVLYRLGCVHLMLRDRKDSLESSEKFLQRALAIAEQQCAARVASWHSAAAAVGPPFARNESRRDQAVPAAGAAMPIRTSRACCAGWAHCTSRWTSTRRPTPASAGRSASARTRSVHRTRASRRR